MKFCVPFKAVLCTAWFAATATGVATAGGPAGPELPTSALQRMEILRKLFLDDDPAFANSVHALEALLDPFAFSSAVLIAHDPILFDVIQRAYPRWILVSAAEQQSARRRLGGMHASPNTLYGLVEKDLLKFPKTRQETSLLQKEIDRRARIDLFNRHGISAPDPDIIDSARYFSSRKKYWSLQQQTAPLKTELEAARFQRFRDSVIKKYRQIAAELHAKILRNWVHLGITSGYFVVSSEPHNLGADSKFRKAPHYAERASLSEADLAELETMKPVCLTAEWHAPPFIYIDPYFASYVGRDGRHVSIRVPRSTFNGDLSRLAWTKSTTPELRKLFWNQQVLIASHRSLVDLTEDLRYATALNESITLVRFRTQYTAALERQTALREPTSAHALTGEPLDSGFLQILLQFSKTDEVQNPGFYVERDLRAQAAGLPTLDLSHMKLNPLVPKGWDNDNSILSQNPRVIFEYTWLKGTPHVLAIDSPGSFGGFDLDMELDTNYLQGTRMDYELLYAPRGVITGRNNPITQIDLPSVYSDKITHLSVQSAGRELQANRDFFVIKNPRTQQRYIEFAEPHLDPVAQIIMERGVPTVSSWFHEVKIAPDEVLALASHLGRDLPGTKLEAALRATGSQGPIDLETLRSLIQSSLTYLADGKRGSALPRGNLGRYLPMLLESPQPGFPAMSCGVSASFAEDLLAPILKKHGLVITSRELYLVQTPLRHQRITENDRHARNILHPIESPADIAPFDLTPFGSQPHFSGFQEMLHQQQPRRALELPSQQDRQQASLQAQEAWRKLRAQRAMDAVQKPQQKQLSEVINETITASQADLTSWVHRDVDSVLTAHKQLMKEMGRLKRRDLQLDALTLIRSPFHPMAKFIKQAAALKTPGQSVEHIAKTVRDLERNLEVLKKSERAVESPIVERILSTNAWAELVRNVQGLVADLEGLGIRIPCTFETVRRQLE